MKKIHLYQYMLEKKNSISFNSSFLISLVMADPFLSSLMEKSVRVTLCDDRLVTGSLHCVDYLGNLILYGATVDQAQKMSSCMVAGKHMKKIEVVREGGVSDQ